jgi:hypothetical protein
MARFAHGCEAARDGFDPATVPHPFEGEPVDFHRLSAARFLEGAFDLAAEHLKINRALGQAPGKRPRPDQNGERCEGKNFEKEAFDREFQCAALPHAPAGAAPDPEGSCFTNSGSGRYTPSS